MNDAWNGSSPGGAGRVPASHTSRGQPLTLFSVDSTTICIHYVQTASTVPWDCNKAALLGDRKGVGWFGQCTEDCQVNHNGKPHRENQSSDLASKGCLLGLRFNTRVKWSQVPAFLGWGL